MLCSALPCCEFDSFSGGKVLLTLNKRHVLPSQLHLYFGCNQQAKWYLIPVYPAVRASLIKVRSIPVSGWVEYCFELKFRVGKEWKSNASIMVTEYLNVYFPFF